MFIVWGLPYAGASLYDLLRGEWFLSWSALGEKLPNWLPPLWFGVGILAFLIVTFEGAYRLSHRTSEENKPILEIDVEEEPGIFGENYNLNWESFWRRVRVTNSGGAVAKGCNGTITRFIDDKDETIQFDPVPLHWILTLWQYQYSDVSIKKKQKRHLDVLVQKKKNPSTAFLFLCTTGVMDKDLKPLPASTSKIEITVYSESDNVEPCTKVFCIDWKDDAHSYRSLSMKPSTLDKEGFQTE